MVARALVQQLARQGSCSDVDEAFLNPSNLVGLVKDSIVSEFVDHVHNIIQLNMEGGRVGRWVGGAWNKSDIIQELYLGYSLPSSTISYST
jgi:hypothetical protein